MKALRSHTLAWVLDALGQESIARLFLFAIAGLSGVIGIWNQGRIISWSVAGSFGATGILSWVRRIWENRLENYRIIYRGNLITLKDDGRLIIYEVHLKVRATQKNLSHCAVRFRWTGQTSLLDPAAYEAIGTGFHIVPEHTDVYDNFKFEFDQPLKKFHTHQVGIRFTLKEPERRYSTFVGIDPAAWSWSPLSKLVTRLVWDNGGLVDVDSIWAGVYRSSWNRHRRDNVAMNKWTARDLRQVDNIHQSREWIVTPVRHDRYYYFEFAFTR